MVLHRLVCPSPTREAAAEWASAYMTVKCSQSVRQAHAGRVVPALAAAGERHLLAWALCRPVPADAAGDHDADEASDRAHSRPPAGYDQPHENGQRADEPDEEGVPVGAHRHLLGLGEHSVVQPPERIAYPHPPEGSAG